MEPPNYQIRSRAQGIVWPSVPDGHGGQLAAMLQQLDQTQWLPPEELREKQFHQLGQLLNHAARSVPYYQRTLTQAGWTAGTPITPEQWSSIPILKRSDVQAYRQELRSTNVPKSHGHTKESHTSGSTGEPVAYVATGMSQFMWEAITLRFHLWHRHDFSGKLCAIRAIPGPIQEGVKRAAEWGAPISHLVATGPLAVLDCRQDVRKLLSIVREEDPAYLLGLPSTLVAMAEAAMEDGTRLPHLRHVMTYAEMVPPLTRELVRKAWGVEIGDIYSCEEAGYIALQCPDSENYHIQSESLLVELLDDAGRPCQPGEVGRVVVTTLVNFATPLIRYELLDYAEAGEPCPCGRSLPVIRSVKGRLRNLISTPDGRRYWPVFHASVWAPIAPIRQLQLIQKTPAHFEAKVVMDRELTAAEQSALANALNELLGYPYTFTYRCQPDRIRGKTGKFEAIISEVTPGR